MTLRASPIVRAPYALPKGVPAIQVDPRRGRWLRCMALLMLTAAGSAAGFLIGRSQTGELAGVAQRR